MENGKISNFYKVIVIGDGFVGKTGITVRFCEGQFNDEYKSTIGANFGSKRITFQNKTYALQLWDIAGQKRFKIFRSSYYAGASCVVLVYDVTNRLTFLDLQNWICEYQKVIGPKPTVIVGNKVDLPLSGKIDPRTKEPYQKEVGYNELQKFAFELNVSYMETSAKTNHNIDQLFETAIQMVDNDVRMKKMEMNSFPSVELGFDTLTDVLDESSTEGIHNTLIRLKQSIFNENPYSMVLGNLSQWIEFIEKEDYDQHIKSNLEQTISAWKYYHPIALEDGVPVTSDVTS